MEFKSLTPDEYHRMLDDGFGNSWSKTCPFCKMQSMEIVRPGKVQCAVCGDMSQGDEVRDICQQG